ncbi:MAG: hypothetical protein OXC61_07835 [Flavobacteriaceae bacterium]|nr:hypothetical protein [Flavobacteriaceae bacterium]
MAKHIREPIGHRWFMPTWCDIQFCSFFSIAEDGCVLMTTGKALFIQTHRLWVLLKFTQENSLDTALSNTQYSIGGGHNGKKLLFAFCFDNLEGMGFYDPILQLKKVSMGRFGLRHF